MPPSKAVLPISSHLVLAPTPAPITLLQTHPVGNPALAQTVLPSANYNTHTHTHSHTLTWVWVIMSEFRWVIEFGWVIVGINTHNELSLFEYANMLCDVYDSFLSSLLAFLLLLTRLWNVAIYLSYCLIISLHCDSAWLSQGTRSLPVTTTLQNSWG